MTNKITVLPGDGIGPEITQAALDVLEAASPGAFDYELQYEAVGGDGIDRAGDPCPEATIEACTDADAILLGAIGGPKWEEEEKTPENGLLQLRESLGLYANLRPTKVNDSLLDLSPLKPEIAEGTDFMMVRELIGGLYFGRPKYYDDIELSRMGDDFHRSCINIEMVDFYFRIICAQLFYYFSP